MNNADQVPNEAVFKSCPACGGHAPLVDSRKIVCENCGFKLYLNAAAAVAALIFDADGRLLVIRRNHDPRKGFLDLPGGFVDFGESGESALRREISEELGADIGACKLEYYASMPNIYRYCGVTYNTLDIFYVCRAEGSLPPANMKPNDEISEILYKHPKDINIDEIAFESMKKLIEQIKSGGGL